MTKGFMSDVTIKEYCDSRVCQLQKLWEQRFQDASIAIQLARETIDHRLEGMNELREQIGKERGTFVNRELFDKLVGLLEERVRQTETWKAEMVGRMWLVGGFLFTLQVAIAVYVFVYMHK